MSYNGKERKAKADDTRQKIYECADKLFSDYDFDKVSIDSIVKAAGVSKGSFYVHFDSKDALITALITDYVETLDKSYRCYLDSFSNDTSANVVFLAFIGKIADELTKIGCDKMKAVYKAQITKNHNTETVTNYNRAIYKMFSIILERGIRRGDFKTELPLDMLTKHLMIAIRGITYEWCIRYPAFDYKTEAVSHFKIILEGLRKS